MSFLKKSFGYGAILGVVFLFLLFSLPASASTLTTWQNMASNATTTLYFYDYFNEFLNNSADVDLAGFHYWKASTTPNLGHLYLKDLFGYDNYSISVPLASEGYHFWTLQEGGIDTDRIFRYQRGGTPYYGYCTTIKTIALADKTLQLSRCNGVEANPISAVNISMGQGTISSVYLLVYTDDNLDTLIFDEASMYDYLGNLANYNSLFGGWSSTTPAVTLPAGTCENLDIFSGALCRVITFLFVPSATSLSQFSNLKDLISVKPPFGYWTSVKNYLATLNSTSTPAFSLTAEIEDISIFGTLKTALAWILWIFFGFWIIKRIARFDF
jgi:hypothetical protein